MIEQYSTETTTDTAAEHATAHGESRLCPTPTYSYILPRPRTEPHSAQQKETHRARAAVSVFGKEQSRRTSYFLPVVGAAARLRELIHIHIYTYT
jgi:hypothetical protein